MPLPSTPSVGSQVYDFQPGEQELREGGRQGEKEERSKKGSKSKRGRRDGGMKRSERNLELKENKIPEKQAAKGTDENKFMSRHTTEISKQ